MKRELLRLEGFEDATLLTQEMPALFGTKSGRQVRVVQVKGLDGYEASVSDGVFAIRYGQVADMMMCLGDIIAGDVKADGTNASAKFKFRGAMIDCSRNAVPTVKFLKGVIVKLALLGFNKLCLYTEDTFEVEGEPLIGFGRGAYSQSELRELDDFAFRLGVEMFPCLQTLGHLQEILKFDKFRPLQDNNAVIDAENPASEKLLRKLIENAAKPYRSKLIHIGSDEPWGLGRGRRLDFDKPMKPGEIYARQIARMNGICESLGLKPIVWADYLIGGSGEAALDEAQRSIMPGSALLNYWKYTSVDAKEYERDMKSLPSGNGVVVSPSVWSSNRLLPCPGFAMKTTSALMRAAHAKGVDMALDTIWADDGAECLFNANWPALAHFAAWCRHSEPCDDFWRRRSGLICGIPYERAELFTAMQNPENYERPGDSCPAISKSLFYDDPLLGFGGLCLENGDFDETLLKLSLEASKQVASSEGDADMLKFASLFAAIAGGKLKLLRAARKAIRDKDRMKFYKFAKEGRRLAALAKRFKKLYAKLWLKERKPFGFEVLETRLAGVESRLDTFAERAQAYAGGAIAEIPELRLERPEGLLPEKLYAKAVSISPLSNNRSIY